MIFTHKLADQILAGEKTVTRRPCVSKAGRRFNPPKVGDLLPIQRGYAKACAAVRVTVVRREPQFDPATVDDAEARREGMNLASEFEATWNHIYGWESVDVWRIEFELVLPGEDGEQ